MTKKFQIDLNGYYAAMLRFSETMGCPSGHIAIHITPERVHQGACMATESFPSYMIFGKATFSDDGAVLTFLVNDDFDLLDLNDFFQKMGYPCKARLIEEGAE